MEPRVVNTASGCMVYGEDFVTTCSPLNTATGWSTIAGFPVSPFSLGPNMLADMCRTYSEWKCKRLGVMYVPAIGTGSNGQVALYRKTDRSDPHIDPNGSAFFNYVLSQQAGVLGPVWQPMGVEMPTSGDWRSTVPMLGQDINDDADGEVFAATNNFISGALAPSIGIIKIQYLFEFRGMQRNPRLSMIPVPRQIYMNVSLGSNGAAVLITQSVKMQQFGADQSGSSTVIAGQRGDIYKFIVDTGKSSFGVLNANLLFAESAVGTFFPVSIENGYTCYVWFDGTNFYPCRSYISACTVSTLFNATNNSAVWNLVGMLSLVGNTNVTINQDI